MRVTSILHIVIHTYMKAYIYLYIEREKERERDREDIVIRIISHNGTSHQTDGARVRQMVIVSDRQKAFALDRGRSH